MNLTSQPFAPTHMGTLFFLRDASNAPLPFLAMYECPKVVLATIFRPDGATCVHSYYLEQNNGDTSVIAVKQELNGTTAKSNNELIVPSSVGGPRREQRRSSSCGNAATTDSTNPRSHSTRRIRYLNTLNAIPRCLTL